MRDYKGWTAKERVASLKKTKAAIAAGIIPPPTECNRCGKNTGRIDYHNHDYSDPIKHLEQLCQGCHTRLHRLENKEIDTQKTSEHISHDIREVDPKIAATKVTIEKVLHATKTVTSDEMLQVRIDFTKALGLEWSENQNANSGYKFEYNLNRRQQFLDEAFRLREQYAEMVNKTGRCKDILRKMDRNLANRDRQAIWK